MLVKDLMSTPVISLDENASIMKAVQVLKEYNIRRIPVTREGKIVGIITDRDIKEAIPSKLVSYEIHEMYYFFSELKLKDIMTKDPITIYPETTIGYAATLMVENKISGLPVINKEREVIGIITQTDIFKIFVNMTGTYLSPNHLTLTFSNEKEIFKFFEIFKKYDVKIFSFLTWKEIASFSSQNFSSEKESYKRLALVRFEDIEEERLNKLLNEIKSLFKDVCFVKEDITKIIK